MKYIVYKTTNKINNKYYIGVHQTNDIEDGYLGSGKVIRQAIKRYGYKAFYKDILAVYNNKNDMYAKEKELVNEKTLSDPLCYNLLNGGRDTFKNSIYNLNKAVTARHKKKYIYVSKRNITKCISPVEEKKYIENGWLRGNKTLSKRVKGHITSGAHRNKISKTLTGTLFVNKEGTNKRIKPEELSPYIAAGWLHGLDRNTIQNRKTGCHKGVFNGSFNKKLMHDTNGNHRRVYEEKTNNYLQQGWKYGWDPVLRAKFKSR